MSITKRTDLAREAMDLYREANRSTKDPDGIRTVETRVCGVPIYKVVIETADGAEKLGRPIGTYVTAELDALFSYEDNAFSNAVDLLRTVLTELLPPPDNRPVMVVGLGNRAITPDALGPLTADRILATRHLQTGFPDHFAALRAVTVLTPGVLGTTGLESAEVICSVVDKIHPSALILVDALAARDSMRLCRTVQISDSGITPGSGIGNRRVSIDKTSTGIPCIAIGVPTVVDVLTLAADLPGVRIEEQAEASLRKTHGQTFVTHKEIDRSVSECAKVIAYGINAALQPQLRQEELALLLA